MRFEITDLNITDSTRSSRNGGEIWENRFVALKLIEYIDCLSFDQKCTVQKPSNI